MSPFDCIPQYPGKRIQLLGEGHCFLSPPKSVASGSNSLFSHEGHGEDYISFFPIPSFLANVCCCHTLLIAAERDG